MRRKVNASCSHSQPCEEQQTHIAQLLPELKAGLLAVTLISFYYHGFSLIISSSFLNPATILHAYEYGGGGGSIILQSHHQSSHQLHQDGEYDGDSNEQLQNERERTPSSSSSLNNGVPQANDILTELIHSQGRTHHEDQYEQLGEKALDPLGTSGADDEHEYKVTINDQPVRRDSIIRPVKIKERYALLRDDDEGGKAILLANSDDSSQKSSLEGDRAITCKDESGNGVSWFIAYKLPQLTSTTDPLIQQGSKYFYILPSGSSWTPSQYPIHDSRSILGQTLEIMWNDKFKSENDIAQVLYNDQAPSKPAVVRNGHTKGLIITSSIGGLWLQHSCPHFPDQSVQNFSSSYPPGGLINGQMFFCMSIENATSVDVIGSVLQYTKPFVYNHSIPIGMNKLFPQLTNVAENNATIRRAPWFHTYEMVTSGSSQDQLHLKVFAKGPKFHKEIYSAWVALDFGIGLDVQSWLNGAHPFNSNCTSNVYPVYNVLMKVMDGQNFSYSNDHSKWAVSLGKDKPVTCIGDLNRMKPQKTRGGVAICMTSKQIWSVFNGLVEQTQPCNSTSLLKTLISNKNKHKLNGNYQPK